MVINQQSADIINSAFRRAGVAFRFDCVSATDARVELEQNPSLLEQVGLSQAMSGDITDTTLDAAKGRPFVDPLTQRIKDGGWKPYFGIISRLANGGVQDGVTRLISIAKSGTKGVWVLTYNDSQPEDFAEYDDPDSARIAQDVFRSAGYSSAIGNVLAVMVPKAAGGADPATGKYVKVSRDVWWQYFLDNKDAFVASAEFVQVERGSDGVVYKNLAALMHFLYVTDPTAKRSTAKSALRLLTAYKEGIPSSPEMWDEKRMVKLSNFLAVNGDDLHERNKRLPCFTHVLSYLLNEQRDIVFKSAVETDDKGVRRCSVEYTYPKAAAAGR